MNLWHWENDIDKVQRRYSENKMSQCHFPTTNLTLTVLRSKPAFRGEKTTINKIGNAMWHNMEARSHTIVAMEKQYSECVSVALVIQHAVRMRRITHIFICGVSGTTIFFPRYLIHGVIFRKMLLIMQRMFWSLHLLFDTFCILRRVERDTIKNIHWSSCKVAFILLRF